MNDYAVWLRFGEETYGAVHRGDTPRDAIADAVTKALSLTGAREFKLPLIEAKTLLLPAIPTGPVSPPPPPRPKISVHGAIAQLSQFIRAPKGDEDAAGKVLADWFDHFGIDLDWTVKDKMVSEQKEDPRA